MMPLDMSHKGFKAYDIRGVIPEEVNEDLAYRVGRAYADLYHPTRVALGRDMRLSSEAIAAAVAQGLMDGGADVMDIGLCGTEMMYFATFYYGLSGGVMVTASHNPSNHNGLKLVGKGGVPIGEDSGLKDIETLAFSGEFQKAARRGSVSEKDITDDYVRHILTYCDPAAMKPLKIVVNAGNGCAGIAFKPLAEHLPFTFVEMHMRPDGTFPHGVPNPMLEENRVPTMEKVKETHADMGIAWDGDFDRCFFVDEKGHFVEGYYMVGLLAGYMLQKHPGEIIVHDPRCWWNTTDIVAAAGGRAQISKGGHAFMKETMRRVGAVYGAEMSAHHFFRDFSYCDSGMIPWLIVAEIISRTGKSLSALVGEAETAYPCSGEINLPARDVEKTLSSLEAHYAKEAESVSHLDGLGMEFGSWHFNLRPSNTEPLIRFNMETRGDRTLLAEKQKEIIDFVQSMD